MALTDELKRLGAEETQAYLEYLRLAGDADDAGMHLTAKALRKIAEEELKHSEVLTRLWMEPELGPPAWEKPARSFPRTYGDWVNLGMDIKEKYPDDPVMRAGVNASLRQILAEEERTEGWSAEDAAEAKRWLTEKAGELGIK